MGFIKFFFIAITSIILITFCIVNRGVVSISLFPFPYIIDVPIFILTLLCIAVGVIVAGLLFNIKIFTIHCQLKKAQRRVEALENENKILRCERDHSTQLALTKQAS